jgi:hypothetical protein
MFEARHAAHGVGHRRHQAGHIAQLRALLAQHIGQDRFQALVVGARALPVARFVERFDTDDAPQGVVRQALARPGVLYSRQLAS